VAVTNSDQPPGIEIRNLKFKYDLQDSWVIDGATLKVNAGESVAIVGPSGCGKSTLLKILSGVLNQSAGEIRIGGIPIKQIGLVNYRNKIGVVMQNDTLFSGSISENISFFATQHDQCRVEECAKAAALHEEIMNFPMGYSTLIGELGNVLSGGQRQRLMLARALYKRPAILFLDEATSHLDSDNEKKVSDAIGALKITRIIVAHRTETIARSDRVVFMEKGKMYERGYRSDGFSPILFSEMPIEYNRENKSVGS